MAQAQAATASAPLPPAKPATTEQAREKTVPAKILFGEKKLPSVGKPMAIGYYPRGCLQGGVELPVNGPTWQVMRLSRNRNWGHPSLMHFLEKFAPQAAKATGWKGVSGRRYGAAARRTHRIGSCKSPNRPRRRHLVHADARSHAQQGRA